MTKQTVTACVVLVTLAIFGSGDADAQWLPASESSLPQVSENIRFVCNPVWTNQGAYGQLIECRQAMLNELTAQRDNPAQIIALSFFWNTAFKNARRAKFGDEEDDLSGLERELQRDEMSTNTLIDKLVKTALKRVVVFLRVLSKAAANGVFTLLDGMSGPTQEQEFHYEDIKVQREIVFRLQPHIDADANQKSDNALKRAYPNSSQLPLGPSNLRIVP